MRWFDEHLRQEGVDVRTVSEEYGGVAIFGPRARDLLADLTPTDVSNQALPFMSVAQMDVHFAPAIVGRLSVTGELGYEIYTPTPHLFSLLERILEVASDLKGRLVGIYAINSLRLEKGYGIWSREFSRDYTAKMSGLDRFVDFKRSDFIGHEAVLRERDQTPKRRLVTLAVTSDDADASGYEPIWSGDHMVGFATSGGYGHCAGASLAMGYVDSSITAAERDLSITILGERRACRILAQPLIDPAGERLRR
jgi:dimethylglycine dehydrogenase